MCRVRLTVIVIALVATMIPGTAVAWCNGPGVNGYPGNGYGTHDWLLDRAIKIAGKDGEWVNRTTALRATDNPDSQDTPRNYHHFRETGAIRGGPQIAAELYHQAVVAYRAGDMTAASKALGTLSHYYSDILEPFHATAAAADYKSLHVKYEFAVDDYQNTPTRSSTWITVRGREPVTDIRTKAIAAGTYARSLFPSLLASYRVTLKVTTGTPNRITRLVQSRAVNDLADIIASIPSGSGETTSPATIDMDLSRTNPRPNTKVGAFVYCYDSSGRPLDAVGVKYVWHLPSGTKTYLTFTNADGRAYRYEDIGSSPIGKAATVSTYVTVNGVTTVSTRTYTPSR